MENIKFKHFLENAKLLNGEYRIIPLLYGSLDLEQIPASDLSSGDIDILIPEEYLSGEKWLQFIEFLETNGYTLVDEIKHVFIKEDSEYAFAPIEGLKEFADIDSKDVGIYEIHGIKYKSLSLNQYLTVYQKSLEKEHEKK